MGKKKIVVAVVGVLVVLLAGLLIWRVLGKGSGLKLGMSSDEVVSFLESHGYQYEQHGPYDEDNGGYKLWFTVEDEVEINSVKGHFSVWFESEKEPITEICFTTKTETQDEMDEKSALLKEYISDKYGELVPKEQPPMAKVYNCRNDNLHIFMACPYELDEHSVISLNFMENTEE